MGGPGVILGAPGAHFGAILGSVLEVKIVKKSSRILSAILGCLFGLPGVILESFLEPKMVEKSSRILSVFLGRLFGVQGGCPKLKM